jgi:hypothetical protein
MLRGLGQDALAAEMEAEAEAVATNSRNAARTKRIKSGTRRLTSAAATPAAPPPGPDLAGTRRLADLRTGEEETTRRPAAAQSPPDHEPTRRLTPPKFGE